MSFLALAIVFVLEQLQPLDYTRWIKRPFAAWLDFLERNGNAGDSRHGVLVVAIAVGLPFLAVLALYWGAAEAGAFPAFLLAVVVLYGVMGFRQFSHFYTDIQTALRMEDPARALALLAEWRGESLSRHGTPDIARIAIETALVAAHRHVFAVLLWFVLLGPAGAVLYRVSHLCAELLFERRRPEDSILFHVARQWFAIMEWLPARVTAAVFAVVGNFEDALYCWRTLAPRWRDRAQGIVLASGAGALGVRLGFAVFEDEEDDEASVTGEVADLEFMQSAIGLVWRAIALWLLLLLVLGLVRLTG
ncbi:MAG: CobD/CbiB family protein [Zoogloeaceae bacterium]|jgi:cobalamin biosynthesis protein CobD/CbiB|nr:CobD/CbiB family protein [Zoogloeaceae bacterium]